MTALRTTVPRIRTIRPMPHTTGIVMTRRSRKLVGRVSRSCSRSSARRTGRTDIKARGPRRRPASPRANSPPPRRSAHARRAPSPAPAPRLSDPHGAGFGDLERLTIVVTQLYGSNPLSITEYGYQTNPPDTFYGVSWAAQAAYLREAYRIARANPRIDLLTWFL